MVDVYTEEKLENSLHYQVKSFASIYLENKGEKFEIHQLPVQAQLSSVNQILVEDFNNDGNMDYVLGNLGENKLLLITAVKIMDEYYETKKKVDQKTIHKNLRCLVCQGQSIADSNSDFAQTIKLVVKDLIKDGKTEREIYAFMADKYGDWIVFKPQVNKQNFILWFLTCATDNV